MRKLNRAGWPTNRGFRIRPQAASILTKERRLGGEVWTDLDLCPFEPGAGGFPPYLAGRESEQREIEDCLARLEAGKSTPSDIFLFGPRGNGKTVLLGWTDREATSRSIEVINLSIGATKTPEALLTLLKRLARQTVWGKVLGAVSRRGVRFRPWEHGAGIVDGALAKLVARRPLLLMLDEAQTVPADVGRELLGAVQGLRTAGAPVLLVIAGTPDLPRNLGRMQATFWERSRILPIMRLDDSAAADAIGIPLRAASIPIASDALAQVVRESHGYPFFVQLWGKALWRQYRNSSSQTLASGDVDSARGEFETARNRFYDRRYRELQRHGLVTPAAALSDVYEDEDEVDESEIDRALKDVLERDGRPAGKESVQAVRSSLHDLGYIWAPGGREEDLYLSGITSLMSFVAQRAATTK